MSDAVEDIDAQVAVEGAVTDDRDYVSEAREQGWRPKEEFNGPEGQWKPAQQFIEDGEKILPIVNQRLKKTEETLAKKEAEFQERIDRMERMHRSTQEAQKERHKAEMASVREQMRNAVSEGDTIAYANAEKKLDALEKSAPKDEPETKSDDASVQKAWMAKNNWYDDDIDMTIAANTKSQALARKNPNMSLADNLEQVDQFMRQKFPEKFGVTKPNTQAAVDGGGALGGGGGPSKTPNFNKLPAEAKKQAQQDVKEGLYKDVESWAKVYLE